MKKRSPSIKLQLRYSRKHSSTNVQSAFSVVKRFSSVTLIPDQRERGPLIRTVRVAISSSHSLPMKRRRLQDRGFKKRKPRGHGPLNEVLHGARGRFVLLSSPLVPNVSSPPIAATWVE